jgi:uncharacterized membrane protein YGL010W
MILPRPRHTLREYLGRYAQEHTQLGTRITHMIGIPLIVASIPTAFVNPPVAGGMFVGGWALQYVGHWVFEKNSPAFYGDPYYLLVGPVWVTAEWLRMLGLPVPEALEGSPPAESVANGTAAVAAS